jgi:hypothetical protein
MTEINGGIMATKKSTRKSTSTVSASTKNAEARSKVNKASKSPEMVKLQADLLSLAKRVEELESDNSLLLKLEALESSLESSLKKLGESFKDRLASLKSEDKSGKDQELRAILSRTNVKLKKLLR